MSEIDNGLGVFDSPAAFIRPHHYTGIPELRSALRRNFGNTESLGRKAVTELLFIRVRLVENNSCYFDDVLGSGNSKVESVVAGYQTFFNQLHNLPDDSTIEFGLTKDGICQSCAVGKHCDAIDPVVPIEQWFKMERSSILEIRKSLRGIKAEFGIDYEHRSRVHKFYGYEKGEFETGGDAVLTEVSFTSLVVNTGVLRRSRLVSELK